jgi:hypothetical protein
VIAVQVKARAIVLALRRGLALIRMQVPPAIADARCVARSKSGSVIYAIDAHGVQRELCRGKDPPSAWRAALEALETAR